MGFSAKEMMALDIPHKDTWGIVKAQVQNNIPDNIFKKANEDYVPVNLLNYQELLHGYNTNMRKHQSKLVGSIKTKSQNIVSEMIKELLNTRVKDREEHLQSKLLVGNVGDIGFRTGSDC